MRLLGGDVGGTKTLLRCVEPDGSTSYEARYESLGWLTFDDLLADFLARVNAPIDAACFAVAGPVYEGRAENITNIGWTIDAVSIVETFAIPRVVLVNDFHAVARGVPLLRPEHVVSLHAGERDPSAPIAILGAGTGLGEAILTVHGGVHHVLATEGGHKDFAPQDEEQARLFVHLHRQFGHVSWERVLSGSGIVNIFTFLGGPDIPPADIATLAAAGDTRAVHTFEIFVDLYGSEAGNMALSVLARGGVFVAGGIAAKNAAWFTDGRFVEAFLRKGRFRSLMETIPLDLIVNEEVGLLGALDLARRAV